MRSHVSLSSSVKNDSSSDEKLTLRPNIISTACFSIVFLAMGLTISIQTNFMSSYIRKIVSSYIISGVILSMSQISAALTPMIFGYIGEYSSFRRLVVLLFGVLTLGLGTGVLGFIKKIGLLYPVLFVQGFGIAATQCSVYSLVPDYFPTNYVNVLIIVEVFQAIGWFCGPLIQGYLWSDSENSYKSFLVTGSIQIISALISVPILLKIGKRKVSGPIIVNLENSQSQNIEQISTEQITILDRLYLLVRVLAILSSIALIASAFSYISVTVSICDYLYEVLKYNDEIVSWLYATLSVLYIVASMLIPFVSKILPKVYSLIVSVFFMAIIYICLSDYLYTYSSLSRTLSITVIAIKFSLIGFFYTFAYVYANILIIETIASKNKNMNGLSMGLYVASNSTGNALGYIVGGVLMQKFGFQINCFVSGIFLLFISFVLLVLKYIDTKK